MNRTYSVVQAVLAGFACLSLLVAPFDLEAAKGTNNGHGNANGNGNGNNQASTSSSGTGQLVLGAPGVGLDFAVLQKTPFSQVTDIGRYYRFEFTGIEAQCDADGVANSYSYSEHMWDRPAKNNNGHGNNCDGVDSSNPGMGPNGSDDPSGVVDDECGHLYDSDGDGVPNHSDPDYNGAKYVYGWWAMWAKVNNQQLGNLTFTSSELNELSPIKRMYFDTPVVFHEQNITLEWSGDGNSNDPDGHFYILGSAIKEPPVPRGELELSCTFCERGAVPTYSWNIERE